METKDDFSELIPIWDRFGLNEKEIMEEKEIYFEKIDTIKQSYLEKTKDLRDKLIKECQLIKEGIEKSVMSLQLPNTEIQAFRNIDSIKPLIEKHRMYHDFYEKFRPIVIEQESKINLLLKSIIDLSNELEYDSNEFNLDINGYDVSPSRLSKLESILKQLLTHKNDRLEMHSTLSTQITECLNTLGMKASQKIESLLVTPCPSENHLSILQEYHEELLLLKQERKDHIAKLIFEIECLREVIGINESYKEQLALGNHILSQELIHKLEIVLDQLHQKKLEMLPDIIEKCKAEIISICGELKCSEEEISENIGYHHSNELEYFDHLQKIKIQLRHVLIDSKDILSLIKKREDTIHEYNTISTMEKIDKNGQLAADKIRRRYKFALPRTEKKLCLLLVAYKEKNGKDFIFNRIPYIENLKHIKLSQSELHSVKLRKRSSLDRNILNK